MSLYLGFADLSATNVAKYLYIGVLSPFFVVYIHVAAINLYRLHVHCTKNKQNMADGCVKWCIALCKWYNIILISVLHKEASMKIGKFVTLEQLDLLSFTPWMTSHVHGIGKVYIVPLKITFLLQR